ncbi:MAG: hypothetical protein IH623_03865 [Verrucomicrobia bacterium]|nr:hypothetical protein [Verrucomicrobiota bacterium]
MATGAISNFAMLALVVGAWLGGCLPLHAGIPEPDLVWYGKVTGNAGGVAVRITTGTLVWRVETLGGNPVITRTTQLTDINDQFSFLLRLPCESLEPGVAASAETLPLIPTPTAYLRTNVTLDGQSLTLSSAPGQFSVALADRGRVERVDLVLSTLPLDSNGNGLADAWEELYFGGIGVDPNADPDGDGMSNLREYRAGTNPTNELSRFEIVEIKAVFSGIQILWSSEPFRSYRVRRSTTLLVSPASYEVIGSGLLATPPYNQLVDTNATGADQFFYLIQLED